MTRPVSSPLKDPYAELLIGLCVVSEREGKEGEGKSNRDHGGGEITLRRNSCTWKEGRVLTVREDKKQEEREEAARLIKEIGAFANELNRDQQQQIFYLYRCCCLWKQEPLSELLGRNKLSDCLPYYICTLEFRI